MTSNQEQPAGGRFEHEGITLHSLHQMNQLPTAVKEGFYRRLLPKPLLAAYGIDPETLGDAQGTQLVTFTCPEGSRIVEVDVRPEAGFPDPLLYLELADTRLNQIEVMLLVINDPESPRFETDRDWRGERTKFGTLERNIPAEIQAMNAGLAPGQVRRGLGLTRNLGPLLEDFVQCLGHDYYLMEPLAYHNAIMFERLGFNYVQGLRKMQWIHVAFQPGGALQEALDGSTPFRQPDAWRTVRGRSWAIHDGILGEPWHGIRMYKKVGSRAGVDTFPGGPY
ncbi:MAG: hypothetical protein M8467_12255 [Anaerolineae bacterium]|nr:hypothetical protein [Anaerolineae bacterium]